MNADEVAALVPQLLEGRYPGKCRQVDDVVAPPGSWLLEDEDIFGLVRATDTSSPFIWIKLGVAIEIPRTSELAHHVACANKQLVTGRAYLAYGEHVALVVVDETVFASSLSWDFQPSIQDLVNRLETSMTHARAMRKDLLGQFGGRPFAREDWIHLAF
jgi:hypothetical protein